ATEPAGEPLLGDVPNSSRDLIEAADGLVPDFLGQGAGADRDRPSGKPSLTAVVAYVRFPRLRSHGRKNGPLNGPPVSPGTTGMIFATSPLGSRNVPSGPVRGMESLPRGFGCPARGHRRSVPPPQTPPKKYDRCCRSFGHSLACDPMKTVAGST